MPQINAMKQKIASRMPAVSGETLGKVNKAFGPQRANVTNHPGESKSGTCALCKSMAGRHNRGSGTALPPYHKNCKCTTH